ncbi:putative cytoplasm protein [Wallemia mellicola]|uniref:Putative cytoplasm protein n=1 Tax=Wallemia mellicola TaxID=1708541 RepID=A0A4T0QGL4_9BASI|nr:hypothetical protein E3Q23_04315 [Wallemia mellicola]TIB84940.1 putative cytoplasm protein [Wallemia mellicola]TIB95107.1 putative cytoplasm protein [Wallemia mellicola]TIC07208.1 putative cytoplasm protein [Wallemia mellicola]TIC21594.1 putative cytoplasm protein [Wallemia mellicola]
MSSNTPDPITLSLFSNRFISCAEAMSKSLEQTSISTNIKERLDFSCAVFSPIGDLIANFPNIPVHLGKILYFSLRLSDPDISAIKYQLNLHKNDLRPGDVLLTNSPIAGGSHLPDITIITPCFDKATNEIIFFTASRGHHSDIGGILPGSMPPNSTSLEEEGAEIVSFKLVQNGRFDSETLYDLLVTQPSKVEGSSGCRNFKDVQSDLKAQVSANHKGIQLLHLLCKEFGLSMVQEYMYHIRNNAEYAVRNLLKTVARSTGRTTLSATDYLDDGSPISLTVKIDEIHGSAVFDFNGTGPELRGNLNAPISVVHSAVIYCARSMLGVDIPLNSGCLAPIDIIIPEGSLLSPSPEAAVCGGNVMTSQRVVDVVLKAFEACAASQGCCNNVTFGAGGKDPITGEIKPGWGYYETVAGGSGATKDQDGVSGTHVHMTNTRITDPEILERRYPILLRRFEFRRGSGGVGKHRGGDGVIREYELMQPLQLSILSERRVTRPYGLHGGGDAQPGLNLWLKQPKKKAISSGSNTDKPRIINLGGKASAKMSKGDVFILLTPGGGGYGHPSEATDDAPSRTSLGLTEDFTPRGSVFERHSLAASSA